MKIFYLLAISLFVIVSCKEKAPEAKIDTTALYGEVMAIHDKVMPEITTIHNLKREMKELESPENKDMILKKMIEMDEVDEAMMRWMEDFKVPEDKTKEEAYLMQEKASIQAISDNILSTISQSKSIIDSLKMAKK
jgi:hypothetical protein